MVKLTDSFLNTVAFLCIEEEVEPGRREVVPRATAFFVTVRDPDHPGATYPYVVTARHCIEETAGRPFFIRFNWQQEFDDKQTHEGEWFLHHDPHSDVAVAPFAPSGRGNYAISVLEPDKFVRADYTVDPSTLMNRGVSPVRFPVSTGDGVVFISLFVQAPGTLSNLPVARFGHIARMPRELVRFRRSDGTEVELLGYLAESYSWGGHSGAPAFWHHPAVRMVEVQEEGKEPVQVPVTDDIKALLGVVSGHFDIAQKAEVKGDILGSVSTNINAGMAVITPAEAIRELLMREDVVADRQERAKRAAEKKSRPAATFDSAFPPVEEEDEYQRFDALVHHLANTPKPKPDESES